MSGPSRVQTGRRANPAAVQNQMRPPARPVSRSGATSSQSQSYMSAARNGAGASVASSPARSVSSRSHDGVASPTPSEARGRKAAPPPPRNDDETNINVVVRCRGRSDREVREGSGVVVSTPGGSRGREVALSMGPLALSNKLYTFDRVFGPETDQSQIYDDVVAPILEEMLSGYNCTIFAYGQTGTGKTYTMSGDMSDNFGTYADNAGIIPRTLYNLFEKIRADQTDADNSVKCSFIELYNEELRDLLAADDINTKVKIFDDSTRKNGVVIQGMEETYIKTAAEGVGLLQAGSMKRQVAATKCNDLSSRSHTVFTITVHVKDIGEDGEDLLRTGKLNLVDLAGSENIGRSGAENKRAREAGMINQSLLTLGRVINSLVDKSSHVPYRESKLTRLLQDSLGGRTKTSIIATVSPAKTNLEETISTLDYASRAKNIRNKPQINQMLSKKTLIREYVVEIERLKGDLIAARQKNGVFLTQESYNEMSEQSESRRILLEEHERKIEVLESQIKTAREQFENTMHIFLDTKKDLETATGELEDTKGTLRETETELSDTKETLAEETVLRKAHQKTEEDLDFVGNKLISTVDFAVGDLDGLHAKIGRLADLEVTNHTTWTKNTNQVTDVTQAVEKEIDAFTEEQNKVTDAVAARISSFVEVQTKKLEEAYDFIQIRLERFNEKEGELSSETTRSKDEMNEVLEEIKNIREDVKNRVGDGLKELNVAAQRIAAEVVEDLSTFGVELHTSYSRLGKDFRTMFDDAQKHIIAQKAEMETLRLELTSATAVAASAATTAQSTLDTILNEERERANLDRQNLIAQISTLINNTADEQDKRMTNRVNLVRNEMTAAQKELETASKSYENRMDVWSAKEEKFVSGLAESRESIKQALVEDWQTAEKHNAAIQATTQAIHAQTVRLVDVQIQNVSVQMQALDSFVTRARSQNETHHTAFVANLDSLATNARESFDRFGTDTSAVKTNVESFGAEVAASTAATKESLQPFADHARQPLAALRGTLDSNPLQEYVPTGQTPRRRTYEVTRELPRTEAHDALLAALGLGAHRRASVTSEEEEPAEGDEEGSARRTPLGEIEVPPPNKKTPELTSGLLADPKAGGPGTGAAFYPAVAVVAHKSGFGFAGGAESAARGSAGAAGLAPAKGAKRGGAGAGDLRAGVGDENEDVLGALPTVKRTRNPKRKVAQVLQENAGVGAGAAEPILTRKRSRDR